VTDASRDASRKINRFSAGPGWAARRFSTIENEIAVERLAGVNV
jgi:hypothetical protein